eukprot:COSAG02_NODE_7677_length_2898_cov_5.833869_4_plen_67_part_01
MQDVDTDSQSVIEVMLCLADGRRVKVDTLTEASETDIAEYKAAEVARFVALREKYKQGAYAKTREGQ